jgi:hypothetical protein
MKARNSAWEAKMLTAKRMGTILGAAAMALALSVGGAGAEPAQGAAASRVRTAFDVLPKSDRLAVQAAEAMSAAEAEACKGRGSAQLGRVCTAHMLLQASQTGKVRFVTVDRREGAATTILTKVPVPVAH